MDSFGYFKYGSNENTELKSGDATGDFQSPCGYYHIERSFNLDSVQIQASRPNYTVQITTKGNERPRYFNLDSIQFSTKKAPKFSWITPYFEQIQTNGPKRDKIVSYKGPRVSIMAENTSEDNEIGTVPTNVNALKLNLTTGQFISVKVDINGATIPNLPDGFTFSSGEIKGAAEASGTYKFNIVSGNATIPVTFIVTDLIRIA